MIYLLEILVMILMHFLELFEYFSLLFHHLILVCDGFFNVLDRLAWLIVHVSDFIFYKGLKRKCI